MLPGCAFNVFCAVMAEGLAVSYSYFVGNMINFLTDPKQSRSDSVYYIAIFGSLQLTAMFFRNRFVMHGF